MIESKALTGDDLALADVWEVAVHARPVALADSARERMGAAREIVEQAAHGRQEHTYGVNTGFACCGATPVESASPTRTRSSAPPCSCARTRWPRATRARAR